MINVSKARKSLNNLAIKGEITSSSLDDLEVVRDALTELETYQCIFEKYNIKNKDDLINKIKNTSI